MNARDEFYKTLSEDLTLHGTKSVLYQYLEKEQEQRAGQEKQEDVSRARSCQLRIRHYRNQLKAGELAPEEYLQKLLKILRRKPQFGKRCGREEKDLESRGITGYCSQDPKPLLKEMKDQLAQDPFWIPPYEKLMRLTEAVLDVAVAYEIREFFSGTAAEQRQKEDTCGDSEGHRAKRADKTLRLIDAYCQKQGRTPFGLLAGSCENKAPSDLECDILYDRLLKEKNEKVFIPLLIDPATGCGICIIGKAYFEGEYTDRSEEYKKIRESCTYGVFYFDNDYGKNIRTGYHICHEFGEFPNYNAARFDGDWCFEKIRQDAEESIKESNQSMPAGVPEIFRKYFADDTEQELEQYRQKIRQEVAACERELKNKETRTGGSIWRTM